MLVLRITFAVGLGLAACTDGKRPDTGKTDHRPIVAADAKLADATPQPKRSWPPDTPSRSACTQHEQCRVEVTLPADDPCCDITTLAPTTVEFVEYVGAYRKIHCDGVQCPPLTLPGPQPSECAMAGRCLAGACGMGCDDPEYMRTQGGPPQP